MLSIVVVNWNGAAHLPSLAASLLAQDFRDWELVLLDNASTDGSAEQAASLFEGKAPFTLVRSPENEGFARGNNLALAQADPSRPLALLLNNDVALGAGCLSSLVAAAAGHPSFDVFTPQLLRASDPGKVDAAGIALSWKGRGRQLREGLPPLSGEPREVPGAPGSALLFRKSILAPGEPLFDEAFFFNNEDTDRFLRWCLAGRRSLLVPEARALHAGSASAARRPGFRLYQVHRNEEWVFARLPSRLRAILLLPHLAYVAGGFLKALASGGASPFLRGKRDALAALPAILEGRYGANREREEYLLRRLFGQG
jgi:GT2 family glycosyltransferase